MIERLIVTGLINSTEYLQQVRPVWDSKMMGSRSLGQIAEWCIVFFDKYRKAPERNIEDVYYDKKDAGEIPSNLIKSIGEDLEDLAYEYDESFNIQYALDQTNAYFKRRHLELHQDNVQDLIDDGEIEAAEAAAANYRGPAFELANDLDLGKKESLKRVESVFMSVSSPLIEYPDPLGEAMNDQLVRGGFVSLMASEKRGKSFWLMDMAIRATYKRYKVAFFQAGDMTEGQQIKRIASYLAKLPTKERYTGDVFVAQADCVRNQLDTCDKDERRCAFGIFSGGEYDEEVEIRRNVTREQLIEAYEDFEDDYKPCTNCEEFHTHHLGTPWLVPERITHAVNVDEAKREVAAFFQKKGRRFKISTHPNDSLTVTNIRNICDRWERDDGFVPDVIVVDYADLLVPEKVREFRHGQNEIWMNLRALSQERDCLVVTATQADAKSYDQNLLKMKNYSEDKRKFGHVTAMFGLNQDKNFREKQLGLMRINQLVVREGEFDSTSTVTVLQSLNLGRPFLDSYT